MNIHGKTTGKSLDVLQEFPDIELKCKLLEIMQDRGLTFLELSELTGIKGAALSDFAKLNRSSISVTHIIILMSVLRLTDLSELFEVDMSLETSEVFAEDRKYIDVMGTTKQQATVLELYRENKKKKPSK